MMEKSTMLIKIHFSLDAGKEIMVEDEKAVSGMEEDEDEPLSSIQVKSGVIWWDKFNGFIKALE